MGVASLYLVLYVYKLVHAIKIDGDRLKLLEKITHDPLCTAHNSILDRLRALCKDLIDVRMQVDNEPAKAKRFDYYYDNLQALLLEIESITNTTDNKPHIKVTKRETRSRNDGVSTGVCPEIYLGTTYGYPFYTKGFETSNCSKQVPMEKLVTLIFDRVPVSIMTDQGENIVDQSKYVKQLIHFVRKVYYYHPTVTSHFLLNITDSDLFTLKSKFSSEKMTFTKLMAKEPRGRALQKLITKIKTPYVLLANQITRFTERINLERLIRVVSSKASTVIAGAGSRNLSGHWTNNCYRSQLKNYTLQFKLGYHRSFNECLVCDHLGGSFLAKTSIIKELKFDSSLDNGLYEDLFLRLKYKSILHGYHGNNHHSSTRSHGAKGSHRNNVTQFPSSYYRNSGSYGNAVVVSCPDVMFYVQKELVKDEDLVSFSSKHSIRKIEEADGRVRWYGCKRDVIYRTGDRCTLRHGLAVAPCCLENLGDAVKFVMAECERSNVVCELQEGTLLGAIKLNKVLPWERDADITFLTSDYDKLLKMKSAMQERGYLWREISM